MLTAVRRVAWAGWAGWICKEPRGSLLPDVRRLVDRETPGGKLPGVFSFAFEEGVLARADWALYLKADLPLDTLL